MEVLVRVDPGVMAVTPPDLDGVTANQGNAEWRYVRRYASGIEQRHPGHLIPAGGAVAAEPQVTRGIHGFMIVIPGDDEVIVSPVDALWQRSVCHSVSNSTLR